MLEKELFEKLSDYIIKNLYRAPQTMMISKNAFISLEMEDDEDEDNQFPEWLNKKGKSGHSLIELVQNPYETFSEALLRIIDIKGFSDSEVYKRAGIDRRLFSKMRANRNYRPRKKTVIELAIAMRLNLEETNYFLERAGFSLSRSSRFDIIIEYFIIEEKYDFFLINEALRVFHETPLRA